MRSSITSPYVPEGQSDQSRMQSQVSSTFVVLGAACILFSALALSGRTSASARGQIRILRHSAVQGESNGFSELTKKVKITANEVTFPSNVSDEARRTTALVAVRGVPPSELASSRSLQNVPSWEIGSSPLSLPAQQILHRAQAAVRSSDSLDARAHASIQMKESTLVEEGFEGGYQLQVSSFDLQEEAQIFVDQLRARGHRAYWMKVDVPGRGILHRVRIGPFATKYEAVQYQRRFESKEDIISVLVSPARKR